uniref:DDE-1 domain-containing protein n=1 Tax=Gongylonema pulchrum TaxID=637853 RepID=A0A183D0R7_9BILA
LLEKTPNTIGVADGRFLAAHLPRDPQQFIPQINKSRWADLDLWEEEPPTWSSCNHSVKLSKKERKKQDIIYG